MFIPPLSIDLDMNWHSSLSRSDPNIQSCQNQFHSPLAANAYNASSYKVSIGHETVNITEIARHGGCLPNPKAIMSPTKKHHDSVTRQSANILSLCFMCFVSVSLILIATTAMHLFLKTNTNHSDLVPFLFKSANITPGFLYVFGTPISSTDSVSNLIISMHDRTIHDLANAVCLLIITLNCFCLLVFSIEIYLGCNRIQIQNKSYSSSTLRFIAICCFYASIPALILVMCLFILLNMSLIPAVISLLMLGVGLVFILFTLLTHFSTWSDDYLLSKIERRPDINSTMYRVVGMTHSDDDDTDVQKTDEISTLV